MAWLKTRPAPEQVSPFGAFLQFLGFVSVLTGLFLIYPPLAFLVGGVVAILVGEKV